MDQIVRDAGTHAGGNVVGSVRALNSSDFSSFLLQAQSSKAKIFGLANAGQMDLPVCERNMPGKKTNLPIWDNLSRLLWAPHGCCRTDARRPS